VVLDTNVWVGALRSKSIRSASRIIFEALLEGHIQLVTSRELLRETFEVLLRPSIQVDIADVGYVAFFMTSTGVVVSTSGALLGCKDPEDDVLLETAINGHASYLVSFDKKVLDDDFRNIAIGKDIRIVSIREFLDILRESKVVSGDTVTRRSQPTFSEHLHLVVADLVDWAQEYYSNKNVEVIDGEIAYETISSEYFEGEIARRLDDLRSMLTLDLEAAEKRLNDAYETVKSFWLRKAELLAQGGRDAIEKGMQSFFLDDIDPEGSANQYRRAESILHAVEARQREF
jgi:putative PIN family toxin of toxin-antitoxin system